MLVFIAMMIVVRIIRGSKPIYWVILIMVLSLFQCVSTAISLMIIIIIGIRLLIFFWFDSVLRLFSCDLDINEGLWLDCCNLG